MIPVLPDRTLNHLLTILENACKSHNVKNILDNAEDIMFDEELKKMMAILYKFDEAGATESLKRFEKAYKGYDKLKRKKTPKFFLVRYVEACKVHSLADQYRYTVRKYSTKAALEMARKEAKKGREEESRLVGRSSVSGDLVKLKPLWSFGSSYYAVFVV
ncbi:hypothetical protein BDP27DRAFT_1318661 [Rhodocollybia butyracea]|uniref:Uncharacterized protein n=1 Tax=Rhodocollybia butyracea TaxID=206335 RepID=A0A9P5UC13_9AGAR|nr:hypothetical protein BDP27DRAFT_1318661 [Rhodocollybia butyracea]